jgi:site-specific DNA recombinase
VVVYKVDRLTRSLADFAKMVELFDAHDVSFVSITQPFNTATSMGRFTLNVLLSFAQFEREVTGERIRDKIAASKKKGMWMAAFALSATTSAIAGWWSIKKNRSSLSRSIGGTSNWEASVF